MFFGPTRPPSIISLAGEAGWFSTKEASFVTNLGIFQGHLDYLCFWHLLVLNLSPTPGWVAVQPAEHSPGRHPQEDRSGLAGRAPACTVGCPPAFPGFGQDSNLHSWKSPPLVPSSDRKRSQISASETQVPDPGLPGQAAPGQKGRRAAGSLEPRAGFPSFCRDSAPPR